MSCIPHQMKKHISLPDGIAVIHILIEELAHHLVPGIARELQCIVTHTQAQGGKGIQAHLTIEQGEKGMKAYHPLIQGGGRADLIQGTFTLTKGITDHKHDHVQRLDAVAGF